jgi:hypothetical protein
MSDINAKIKDLIDYIRKKYGDDIKTVTMKTLKDFNINNIILDKEKEEYIAIEGENIKIEPDKITNNTNKTKFLTFILNPNSSLIFQENKIKLLKDENESLKKEIQEKKLLIGSIEEEKKRYKLISYILGVITMITIIVIIYLVFIKDKKQE